MAYYIRIFLTPEQNRTLSELRTNSKLPQRVRDRAEVVRLNAHGWTVEKIAIYFDWNPRTVRDTLHRWQKSGLEGLWDSPRPGGKRRWQEADIVYLEDCLRNDPRRYNAKQLAQKLAKERDVELSPQQIRSILRKRG
jgi:transposase